MDCKDHPPPLGKGRDEYELMDIVKVCRHLFVVLFLDEKETLRNLWSLRRNIKDDKRNKTINRLQMG